MIKLWDTDNLSLPVLSLSGESEMASSCAPCEAFRPHPQLSGNLQVDPEIHLPSPGMNLDIAYFYNASSPINGPFGYGRTISAYQAVQASGSPTIVTATRGNGAVVTFQDSGNGVIFLAQIPSVLTSFTKDTTNHLWKEKTLDGFTFAYPLDTTGQISSLTYIEDPVGNRHTYSYVSGKLTTVQDVVGRFVSFGYNASNLLQSIQDWAGRRTTFAYDSATAPPLNLLTTITGPTGCQTAYQYTSFTISTFINTNGYDYLLSGITDPNGYATSYTYDQQKRVTSRELPLVGITTYLYTPGVTTTYQGGVTYSYQSMLIVDAYSGITTHTAFGPQFAQLAHADASGVMLSFTRNSNLQEIARQNLDGAIWTTAYDNLGNVSGTVDPLGYVTTLQRDAYNNVAAIQYADGSMVTHVWGYAGSGFDTSGAKRRLQAVVDPLGNRTSYSYTGRGQLSSVQDALGNMTTHGYDAWGNHISVTDALGYVTTRTYDSAGNVVAGIDPLGHATSTTYDPQNRPLTVMDALGNVTTNAYDSVGNRIIDINPLGYRTTRTYNIFDKATNVLDALGNVTTNVYDALGRHIAIITPDGYHSTTVYDTAGRIISEDNVFGGLQIAYDLAGRRQAVTDALGFIITFLYDIAGRTIARTDGLGYFTSYSYASTGRLLASIKPTGERVTTLYDLVGQNIYGFDSNGYPRSATYDPAGRVVAHINMLGHRTSYIYDAVNQQIAVIDHAGQITSTLYDSRGNRVAKIDANGNAVSYTYDNKNRHIGTRDSLGNVFTHIYDAKNNEIAFVDAIGNRLSTSYDPLGNPLFLLNALGNITTYVYDNMGRKIEETSVTGQHQVFSYNQYGNATSEVDCYGNITTTIYDASQRIIAVINPVGSITTSVYDGQGNVTSTIDALGWINSTIYNAIGLPIASINPCGKITTTTYSVYRKVIGRQDALGRQYTYLYDVVGNRIAVIEPPGLITTTTYDSRHIPICSIYPTSNVVTYVTDNLRRLIAVVNPLGYCNTTVYDSSNRPVNYTDPLGRVTTLSYNALGRLVTEVNPIGGRTTHYYDSYGREVSVQSPMGYLSTYVYDQTERLQRSISPGGYITTYAHDCDNRLIAVQSPLGFWASTIYDSLGQIIVDINPLGYRTTHIYDALQRKIAVVDANGNCQTTIYDAIGNIVAEQNALGNISSYIYNDLKQKTASIDANGAYTTFVYNNSLQLVSVQDILGSLTTFNYATSGVSLSRVDARGWITTYTVDKLTRIVGKIYTDGSRATFTYDAAGQQLVMQDVSGTTASTYDLVGREQSVTATNGSVFTYTYDGVGNRLGLQGLYINDFNVPNRTTLLTTYAYDANNRLASLWNGFNERTTFAYDALDRDLTRTLANGQTIQHTYDPAGRETVLANLKAGGAALAIYTNTYDSVGNRLSIQELDGSRVTFSYDSAYQLINEQRSKTNVYNATYTYDGLGNRLTKVDSGARTTYAYNAANALLLLTPPTGVPTTYSYDGAGNLALETTTLPPTTYTWDGENRLLSLSTLAGGNGTTEGYGYSADGLRKSKNVSVFSSGNPTGITNYAYLWDGQNVAADNHTGGAIRFTNAPDTWGELISVRNASASSYYGNDSQSSVRILVSQSGVVTDRYNYRAFGEAFGGSGTTYNPYRYIGAYGYYQDNSSRYYVRARHLNVALGRWISSDPLGPCVDANLYIYSKNNPMSRFDPSGLWDGELVHRNCTAEWPKDLSIAVKNACCDGYEYTIINPDYLEKAGDGAGDMDNEWNSAVTYLNWHAHFNWHYDRLQWDAFCRGEGLDIKPDSRIEFLLAQVSIASDYFDRVNYTERNESYFEHREVCSDGFYAFGKGLHALEDIFSHSDFTPLEHQDIAIDPRIDNPECGKYILGKPRLASPTFVGNALINATLEEETKHCHARRDTLARYMVRSVKSWNRGRTRIDATRNHVRAVVLDLMRFHYNTGIARPCYYHVCVAPHRSRVCPTPGYGSGNPADQCDRKDYF